MPCPSIDGGTLVPTEQYPKIPGVAIVFYELFNFSQEVEDVTARSKSSQVVTKRLCYLIP